MWCRCDVWVGLLERGRGSHFRLLCVQAGLCSIDQVFKDDSEGRRSCFCIPTMADVIVQRAFRERRVGVTDARNDVRCYCCA